MTDAEIPTVDQNELGFDAGLKKKKKKKAVNFDSLDAPEVATGAPEAENEDDMFAGIKKKSKKKSPVEGEEPSPPADDADDFADLKKKKKSSR